MAARSVGVDLVAEGLRFRLSPAFDLREVRLAEGEADAIPSGFAVAASFAALLRLAQRNRQALDRVVPLWRRGDRPPLLEQQAAAPPPLDISVAVNGDRLTINWNAVDCVEIEVLR